MDFNFTSEQVQLADAIKRFVTAEYSFDKRKSIVHSDSGVSSSAWERMVELGLTALPMPEANDGFGGTAVDMLVVMQELGRGLVVEPYFATVVAAEFVKRLGSEAQHARLSDVAAGTLKMASAMAEKQSRFELNDVKTVASRDAGGYTLNGMKTVVVHGAQANLLVVSARTSGNGRDSHGISLFLVDPTAAGVSIRDYRTIDGQRAADIVLSDVKLDSGAVLGKLDDAWETIDSVSDYSAALSCAEAIGAMESLNAQTVEYTKTRKQFGAPIAKFQALQHRMVEMFMQLEQARSMAYLAAFKLDSEDDVVRRRSVSAAKVRVGQAAKFVGQQAVQLHGGMGVTDELPAAHYFKRLTTLEFTAGDIDYHLSRFIANPVREAVPVALKEAA